MQALNGGKTGALPYVAAEISHGTQRCQHNFGTQPEFSTGLKLHRGKIRIKIPGSRLKFPDSNGLIRLRSEWRLTSRKIYTFLFFCHFGLC
jgi:hypothetical protein